MVSIWHWRGYGVRSAGLLVALLLCASGASAQGFKWWQSDTYRRELGLTLDQSRRLEDIFQAALPSLRSQKRVLDQAEAEFERLIERGDDTTVMDQVGRVEVARAELNKARALMLLRMRRTLTTDQWIKFGALHQAEETERRAAQGRGHKNPQSGSPETSSPENRSQASPGRNGRAK
jgi:Spy/CpxP family protein refolding chaperone